jgi:YegS/Rv2252/BmrU family lipid kinase
MTASYSRSTASQTTLSRFVVYQAAMTVPAVATPVDSAPAGATLVIANSNASGFKTPAARDEFSRMIADNLDGATVAFTESPDELAAQIKNAPGVRRLIACGGDGTISAVAAAISGTDIVLGVIPFGTFNNFSKDLGIPVETDKALEVLRAGRVESVDVGEVNGRCFVNNSGLGIYPEAVKDRERLRERGMSKSTAAFIAGLRSVLQYRRLAIRVVVDGKTLLRRTPVVFVGNNEYVVDKLLAPGRPSMTDGELCLYIPHPRGRFRFMWFTIRALFGRLQSEREFDIVRTTSFTIESKRSRLRVSLDGEIEVMKPPLEFVARAGALRVIVP